MSNLAAVLREVNERLLITSVREHEVLEASQREKAQLSALLGTLNEGVVIADASGRIVMANEAARGILHVGGATGAQLEEKIAALDMRRVDESPLPADERPLALALRGEVFVDKEMLIAFGDGQTHRVMASAASTKDADDKLALAIVVFRDVTERYEVDQRLAQTERLAAIGTLSAGLAHEINNPLAYLMTNVDYAVQGLSEARDRLAALEGTAARAIGARLGEIATALGEAQEGGLRVHHIIKDVSQFGGLDVAERSVVVLSEVIDRALRMTESLVRERAALRRDYEWTPPVKVNAGQLVQVFVNLLLNAAQAIGEGAPGANEVVLATRTDSSGRAVAEIRDSGPGIPRDIQQRIFEPFFTTKGVGEGSGLGLSVCYSLVKSFGGTIAVQSTLGKGATFRVTLPPAGEQLSDQPPPAEHLVPRRRGRVLIIDDETAITRALVRILQREHDAEAVNDARDAVAHIRTDDAFDIILCDLTMPHMSGMEFYRALSASNPKLARRVVFFTGGACTAETRAFLQENGHKSLTKPVEAEALLHLVADYVNAGVAMGEETGQP